ncbi:hypothetical protein SAMN05421858_4198 [Haladaptatus litoreus]|uniref:DUF7344 domain-containing protein n=1 Tax=Haladaptatus litoreus TaxID=553468 RepID=A0A1N7EFV1_9EURY|nr:hypothetical protein [Haladaptatus litoreus]SIR86956.1 hypothetical protein SAMN05421858_4198 [Haladaptatus litoreus]
MAQHQRPSLPLSEACQILSSHYRRQLLCYLQTKDADVANLDELVTHIHKKSKRETTPEQVRILLIHTHIPKLADYGVIEFDRRNKDIRYRDGTKLEDFLELLPAHTHST